MLHISLPMLPPDASRTHHAAHLAADATSGGVAVRVHHVHVGLDRDQLQRDA